MSERGSGRGRDSLWKGIMIAEIIICYLAFLTVVSYIRAPGRWVAVEPPLLQSGDFVSFAGVPADGEGPLPLENGTGGQAVGYQAELDLSGLDRLQVSLRTQCPAEFAGGVLFVDLYNGEAGYDDPAQEHQLHLQEGLNEAVFDLEPGENAPERAMLRMFTLDSAGYALEGVGVCRVQPLPKVSAALWTGVAACFLLLIGTAAAWAISKRREKSSTGREQA